VLSVAQRHSMADRGRLEGLMRVADLIASQHLPGHVVECGVFRGGSAVVLADRLMRSSPETEMWLYDVFSGMPEPGPEDPPEAWAEVGKFASGESLVRRTFADAHVADDRLHLVVGRFEETLYDSPRPSPIKFLHLDCDWYASVKVCLEALYDDVVPGGAIVLDDYGHWSGCRKATDEFLGQRAVRVTLKPIDYTSHYFFKPRQ
jgi:hypothetical protein